MSQAAFPDLIRRLEPFAGRFDAFRLVAEGCDVYVATYPAGTEIEPHTHDSDNAGVVTRGEMRITVDGVETVYGVGDWYVLPAGTLHAARCTVDTEEIEFWFKPPLPPDAPKGPGEQAGAGAAVGAAVAGHPAASEET